MMHIKWFGKTWGAPICNPAHHITTPAGQECVCCSTSIAVDDQGFLVAHLDSTGNYYQPWHKDCFLPHVIES